MSYPILKLRPSGDAHLRNRHHSIFKTSLGAQMPSVEDGGIVEVQNAQGDFLCYATFNSAAYICGRAISFEKGDPLVQLKKAITSSVKMREEFFKNEDTNAFRLINAEGDEVPGLICDRYGDTLVIQLTTLGMDKLRDWIIEVLKEVCNPKNIFEKSTSPARKKENLEPREGWAFGTGEEVVEVKERGLKFLIALTGSQKTGLFIDQREMRSMVRSLAAGRTVLDCCSYVGGFSLNALMGGALHADAVDYDAAALEQAKKHMAINGVDPSKFSAHAEDVFNFMRRKPYPHNYDFIILDPPAFAKRSSDIEPAKKAYTDLNRLAMQALPAGGLLLTCSCSYQVDMALFQTIIFHAARQANRSVKIIQKHRHAFDHPINLYHPEVDYLKSLLLWID